METKKRRKQRVANTGTHSVQNMKSSPYFVIGGKGLKPHQDKKSDSVPNGWERCSSPWKPGRCYPRTKFKKH